MTRALLPVVNLSMIQFRFLDLVGLFSSNWSMLSAQLMSHSEGHAFSAWADSCVCACIAHPVPRSLPPLSETIFPSLQ